MKNLNRRTLLANALPATLATGLAGAAQTDASPPPVDVAKLGELIAAYDQAVARVPAVAATYRQDMTRDEWMAQERELGEAVRAEEVALRAIVTAIHPARVLLYHGRVFFVHGSDPYAMSPTPKSPHLLTADPAEVLVVS